MEWINIFGLFFIVVIMIPNIIYTIKYRDRFVNKWSNKTVEIIENIGRFGCLGFMIFNIPGTWFGWFSDKIFVIYLIVNIILLFLYYMIWIICFKKNTMFTALSLSSIPSAIFLLDGLMSRSILLVISSLIFAPAHIMISYKNAK